MLEMLEKQAGDNVVKLMILLRKNPEELVVEKDLSLTGPVNVEDLIVMQSIIEINGEMQQFT